MVSRKQDELKEGKKLGKLLSIILSEAQVNIYLYISTLENGVILRTQKLKRNRMKHFIHILIFLGFNTFYQNR